MYFKDSIRTGDHPGELDVHSGSTVLSICHLSFCSLSECCVL